MLFTFLPVVGDKELAYGSSNVVSVSFMTTIPEDLLASEECGGLCFRGLPSGSARNTVAVLISLRLPDLSNLESEDA